MEKEKKLKLYTSAPLPFQGQKRRHVKEFMKIIKILQPETVVDLFGGSGLLSHVSKRANPQCRVIYNDYDNYCRRLAHIKETNELLYYFCELLHEKKRNKRITGETRTMILKKLSDENRRGYVDWITLSSSLKFSMNYAFDYEGFERSALYNRITLSDYSADGYIDGLEVVRADYKELCRQYRDVPGTLFIADPPYMTTDIQTYSSGKYWSIKDYLSVLTALNGLNYIYFSSDKSQITELCQWIDDNTSNVVNIFKGATVKTVKSPTGNKKSYTDIMLFNRNVI
jgi:site-specific DNA-adenine methylase